MKKVGQSAIPTVNLNLYLRSVEQHEALKPNRTIKARKLVHLFHRI